MDGDVRWRGVEKLKRRKESYENCQIKKDE
jgi:hypothetical protein